MTLHILLYYLVLFSINTSKIVMNLFYIPQIYTHEAYPGMQLSLDTEESAHAIKVLRVEMGDIIHVTNGQGLLAKCQVMEVGKRVCMIELVEIVDKVAVNPNRLTVAVAPTKNISRMEWFVEKATEVGIGSITFFISKHSERKELKVDRLIKIATSAMKQSLKTFHPNLSLAGNFKQLVDSSNHKSKFIAHYIAPDQPILFDQVEGDDCIILIGPEGDFSASEVDYALSKGFKAVSLGNTRLRTETAALVSTVTVNLKCNL